MATERMPMAKPVMINVAAPVSPASAISRTGFDAVKYSVTRPMRMPPTAPETTAHHTLACTPTMPVMT